MYRPLAGKRHCGQTSQLLAGGLLHDYPGRAVSAPLAPISRMDPLRCRGNVCSSVFEFWQPVVCVVLSFKLLPSGHGGWDASAFQSAASPLRLRSCEVSIEIEAWFAPAQSARDDGDCACARAPWSGVGHSVGTLWPR